MRDRIDKNLAKYYEKHDEEYEDANGIGRFAQWCDDNEYESDDIIRDLEMDRLASDGNARLLLQFIDQFPVNDTDVMLEVLKSCTEPQCLQICMYSICNIFTIIYSFYFP